MTKSSNNVKSLTEPAHTEEVVQEYMDTLLSDMFPDIPDAPIDNVVELQHEKVVQHAPDVSPVDTETQTQTQVADSSVEVETQPESIPEPEVAPSTTDIPAPEPLRYPQAPTWAQEEFDVLLFEVCGLKLAVSMESLGRIIKVDHETNHLIGRPNWFLGAYNEAENHFYVVDTAKYIMPEKKFDLSESGYTYIIQMQHSKWTLACQKLHTTIRLHPENVKWRTVKGKRPWLAGTVVDQMCALVHVDSLIEILDQASSS